MKAGWAKYLVTGTLLALLAGCSSKPTDRGQQYKDGTLNQPLALVNQPNAKGRPVNGKDFADQVSQIRFSSAGMYSRQSGTYSAIESWLMAGGDTRQLRQFGLDAYQMEGTDNYGNVQFTGYYTPVIQARYTRRVNSSILYTVCHRVVRAGSCQAGRKSTVVRWMNALSRATAIR